MWINKGKQEHNIYTQSATDCYCNSWELLVICRCIVKLREGGKEGESWYEWL